MRLIHCACGTEQKLIDASTHHLPAIPTRNDLTFLDEVAREVLPEDPTPSLKEIASSPSVSYLGEPDFAPQKPEERLRVVVSGSDAALGAVLTRMMRADYMWAEVAYLPADPHSPAAVLWGIPADHSQATALALNGPVRPIPCIRNDAGITVAGSATLSHPDDAPYIGEVVVDSEVLLSNDSPEPAIPGLYGVRLVPTADAPGIAAVRMVTPGSNTPEPQRSGWRRFLPGHRGQTPKPWATDSSTVLTGRAVQSGGEKIQVIVDSVPGRRPVDRVTFYRHLRDIQAVRGAD